MSVHDKDKYAEIKELLGIPEDEPIFILRAQDTFSVGTMARYGNFADQVETDKRPSDEWFKGLNEHTTAFAEWQQANPDKVKVPD